MELTAAAQKLPTDDEVMEDKLSTVTTNFAAYDSFDPVFGSLNELLRLGNLRTLEKEDIGWLREKESVQTSEDTFIQYWEKELLLPEHKRSLIRPLLGLLNKYVVASAVLLYIVFAAGTFAGPLILNSLLNHLSGKNALPAHLLGFLVVTIFLAPMLGFICKEQVQKTFIFPYLFLLDVLPIRRCYQCA